MIGGILFTHGDIGKELLRTTEIILGSQERIVALSNEGCSATLMEEALSKTVSGEGFQDGVVIFVDLARGSCWVAAERLQQQYENVYLISGVNVPMLLRFFYKREILDLPTLVENLREGGIEGIQIVSASSEVSA
jgi:PTS system mannose-specific IIA component